MPFSFQLRFAVSVPTASVVIPLDITQGAKISSRMALACPDVT
jgi:hypothetical protein